jgi:hypothetical protein
MHAPGNTNLVYFMDGEYWHSIRSHAQRAGAEDWELLSIIKEHNPEFVHKQVEKACRTFDDYERDWKVVDALRKEVLNEADKYF